MQVKIIMQARWLYDAVSELSSTSPTRLDITASPDAPYLSLSAVGPLGSASVDFARGRELLETFTVAEKWTQSYKFEMVKAASEAMRLASKGAYSFRLHIPAQSDVSPTKRQLSIRVC
jgi:cell cycle checkpoint protein